MTTSRGGIVRASPVFLLLCAYLASSLQSCHGQPQLRSRSSRRLAQAPAPEDPLDELAPAQLQYPVPVVFNATETQTATIIMLHGLGESSERWEDWGAEYGRDLPYVKWIFPTAPIREITVTGTNQLPGWYNILTFGDYSKGEDVAGLQESARYVQQLIAGEVASGIPSDRVLVSGFSQGGALALLVLRADVEVAGVLAMSTYLPLGGLPPLVADENLDTPVMFPHGTADTVVVTDVARNSYQALKDAGANITFVEYAGLGHQTNDIEMQDIVAFWQNTLPPLVQ